MNAMKQAARHQRRKPPQRAILVPVGLVCAALVAFLVAGLLHFGHGGGADRAVVVNAAGTQAPHTPTAASPTAAAGAARESARPPAARTTPTATATTTAKAEPKATAKPTTTRQPAAATGASAGRIQPGRTYSGVATEYAAADGNGACLFGPAADMMIGAMNETDYDTAQACGAYVVVHAAGGASITVRITNECPLPCAPGQIDLSQQAFAKLADPSRGRIPITWQLVSPSMSSTVSLRYKTGSSRYWCAIQVIGHRNPVALLEVRAGAGWRRLPRTSYNYFLSADGTGCGGTVRVTDIYGQQLTVPGIAVTPNVVQPTGVQFDRH
ncbi:expansin EXLX1 family cellulose-binding protein [Streptacidiphilus carbonis]|uniref:expansin EXLX1 family cellulose-binding protein n=1 Tax=Streptacidiphilus carbonis TaxID=105422 RepID=UPI0005A91CD5|nr:expansin EXLX1 family cellulose-binding protein [Streptacidiphilus carbonis]